MGQNETDSIRRSEPYQCNLRKMESCTSQPRRLSSTRPSMQSNRSYSNRFGGVRNALRRQRNYIRYDLYFEAKQGAVDDFKRRLLELNRLSILPTGARWKKCFWWGLTHWNHGPCQTCRIRYGVPQVALCTIRSFLGRVRKLTTWSRKFRGGCRHPKGEGQTDEEGRHEYQQQESW